MTFTGQAVIKKLSPYPAPTNVTTSWGQGSCQWDSQFDCTGDPHGLAQNGCITKVQRCDGSRDCSWEDLSKPSWDEDPYWCGWLQSNPGS